MKYLVIVCALCLNAHADPLTAGGNHAGEDHAGHDHSGELLDFADLSGSILTSTDFSKASLADVNFTNADLRGAKFTGAYLGDVILTGALLTPETEFANSIMDSVVGLSNRDLRAFDFRDVAFFESVEFRNSNLSGLDLRDGFALIFDGATLVGADLRGSRQFTGENADFYRADLRHISVDETDFSDASFRDADLRFARTDDMDFRGTDFSGADLRFAIIDGDVTGAKFVGANIFGAVFHPDRPEQLDLTGAVSVEHPVPEPGTFILVVVGFAGAALGARRRSPY